MSAEYDRVRCPTVFEEAWIARKLGALDLFCGAMTPAMRRDRLRVHIVSHGLASAIVGKRDGKPESWAQLFERLWHEPLQADEGEHAA